MQNSPGNIEELLGVDQVRNWIAAKCRSEQGVKLVRKAKFSSDFDSVKLWLDQTSEMMRLISGHQTPNLHFYDLELFLTRIKVPGSYLEAEEYVAVAFSIHALSEWLSFLEDEETTPELKSMSRRLTINSEVVSAIENSIDENGKVKDSASPELGQIRKRLAQVEKSARSALQRILKKSISDESSAQESQVTLRDGRLVIPVKAEFKRSITGLVHDESATGQTVYLEPAEALELNNEVRELKNRELREVVKVLISLADNLRSQLNDLAKGAKFLSRLDFIYAKASWALDFNAQRPNLRDAPVLEYNQAIHPILWNTHRKSEKTVVPLNISVNRNQRMIVVSGPNAGGKSVVLKTVGLLQYLIQCGIPVPVQEDSVFGVFSEILLDIGDTQSIEDDLSTYSSHLMAMKNFVTRSSKNSLVLIDEFGKGTEPQFGGAIAEAILERLHDSGCFGIVTTHYQNLKDFADRSTGMVNAAMKYDVGKLEPMYLLEIGRPGSSFAFEIARKIGLSGEIVESAQSKMDQGQVDFDQSLTSLEKEKLKYSKLSQKLQKEEKEVAQLKKDYEALRELLEAEKKSTIREAKDEASRIVDSANKQVEKVIRGIKEHQAEKGKTQQARRDLEIFREEMKESFQTKKKKYTSLEIGDAVVLDESGEAGEIINIKKEDAQVQFGSMKSFVKLNRLQKTNQIKKEASKSRGKGVNILNKFAEFSHELTIRGLRAEEALPKIDAFFDEAIMHGINEVKVVHGKGHGVLRELLRNHLSDHPGIGKIADEHADRGGSGISIVTLK